MKKLGVAAFVGAVAMIVTGCSSTTTCTGLGCFDNDSGPDTGSMTGSAGGPCFPNATCLTGLMCVSNVCVNVPDAGDSGVVMDSGMDATMLTCPKSVSCSNYCAFLGSACTGGNQQLDSPTCTALCNALTTNGTQNLGNLFDTSGNTIGCRTYHSCAASMSSANAMTHCPHANIWSGGDTCGTQCDAFCQIDVAVCTGQNAVFSGMNECLSKCGAWAAGTQGATSGNSLACREHYLALGAVSAPSTNCPKTGDVSAACQ
jgi:hypothetical protein